MFLKADYSWLSSLISAGHTVPITALSAKWGGRERVFLDAQVGGVIPRTFGQVSLVSHEQSLDTYRGPSPHPSSLVSAHVTEEVCRWLAGSSSSVPSTP